jgi:hypothetical protein
VRGIFGIFFCHSLLNRIHDDPDARAVEEPTFSPVILGNLVSRAPGTIPLLLSTFMPSFLCFVPVQ